MSSKIANQIAKARRIADILRESDSIDCIDVSNFDDHQWSIVADLCGYESISYETRLLTVNELTGRFRPADPFEGLS